MGTQQVEPAGARPRPGVLYGLTHTLDGEPVVREPKLLKVGIGCLKGPAIEVYLKEKKWTIRTGFKREALKVVQFDSRQQCENAYPAIRKAAAECPYPRKLDYFTFSRQAADGTLTPDFDAIEAHGERPTSIDVVFFSDDPLDTSYSFWGTSELKCRGDGINAERVIAMAVSPEEHALADRALAVGSKYFPIIDGCYVRGCRFARETTEGTKTVAAPCKPHADLKFQLAKNLRVGGTAYFHTTGFRSISQLFSCLYRFRCLTGGGDASRGFLVGIPFQMLLRQFRTKHGGQAGTAYGVSLEFRAETVDALVKNMIEQGMKFRSAMLGAGAPAGARRLGTAPARILGPAPDEEETDVAAEAESEAGTAKMISAEFDEADGDGPPDIDDPVGSIEAAEEVARQKLAAAGLDLDGKPLPSQPAGQPAGQPLYPGSAKPAQPSGETPEERDARIKAFADIEPDPHRTPRAALAPEGAPIGQGQSQDRPAAPEPGKGEGQAPAPLEGQGQGQGPAQGQGPGQPQPQPQPQRQGQAQPQPRPDESAFGAAMRRRRGQ